MRNDYFTATELAKIAGVAPDTIYKRFDKPGYFKAVRPGSTKRYYIIPKKDFFEWYFKAHNDGSIYELFPACVINHNALVKAYKEYMEFKQQNNEKLRREYLANKRPVYRRKGSYGL